MDSRTARKTLERLPDVPLAQIDDVLAWLVEQQHKQFADLAKFDDEAYRETCSAIDDLLDARLEHMPGSARS
ncbi:hypothetical protein OU415_02415 [Saccharopolyspora sp. WRP15-2]|uniref:Uncharacterized protein n=1 Tax=Saccharopolyspora oryzae TaxID=2997343 RepID=A0ABT4USN4_9PSEU|nr:hypothetical protein [Saccharopolyspora oryzae]MDA3624271.1 hypothetical protein [Saccharopolyspora oryzae]